MKWLILLLVLILSVGTYAEYYADVTFEVLETGEVLIEGETNYQAFSGMTNELTSKEGPYWLLNITAPQFQEYIYRIHLPQYASINYLKSNGEVRIEDRGGLLTIIATGSESPINMAVQYSLNTAQTEFTKTRIISILILAIIAIVLTKMLWNRKEPKQIESKEKKQEEKSIDRKRFTERQLEIIDYLQKHGIVTQAELEKALKLPKSSLSRNIETLVQKGTIFKESKGMSNVIGLKD